MNLGVRFLPEILQQCRLFQQYASKYNDIATLGTAHIYDYYLKVLESPNTKRLLFDARQAKAFDEANAILKAQRELKIHPPFNQFYMELTEPIVLRAQEPGHVDETRALMWVSAVKEMPIYNGHSWETTSVNQLTMYFRDTSEEGKEFESAAARTLGFSAFVERSWLVTDDGRAVCRAFHARKDSRHFGDPIEVEERAAKGEQIDEAHSELPDFIKDDQYFVAGDPLGIENRKQGWWEKAIYSYTNLVFWILAYTMAKSIETVAIGYPRQMIRRYARENKKLPPEWHLVRVKPTFKKAAPLVGDETGIHHSYRYDVIGHLRFLADGAITWVDAHQRGLANDIYIPKTYKVEKDKHIATKEMKAYLG